MNFDEIYKLKWGVAMERTDYRQIFILIGTTLAVYLGFRYLLPLVVPFLFSYLVAVLVQPAVTFAKKKWRFSRGFSGVVCVAVLGGIVSAGIFGLGKILFGQLKNVVMNLPRYEMIFLNEVEQVCDRCDGMLGIQNGNTFQFVSERLDEGLLHFEQEMLPYFSAEIFSFETIGSLSKVFDVFWLWFIVVMGAFFMIKDMEDLKIIVEESVFFEIGKKLFGNIGEVGSAYAKAQIVIVGISALICSGGLTLVGIENSLLWGIGISIFDAFPVLGSGIILIPWALWFFMKGNWNKAAILFTVFVGCQLVREIAEAKILGDKMGIKPVFTLISMYIGTELFGVTGFILGPLGFLLIKNCVQSQY